MFDDSTVEYEVDWDNDSEVHCLKCGAVVADTNIHTDWHKELHEALFQVTSV